MAQDPTCRSNFSLDIVFSLGKFYTEQMFALVSMQLCKHTTSEASHALKSLRDIYTILNSECYKCARMRCHCASGLVVLRICLPQRERRL